MLRSLGGIGRILALTWPALLAWYLGGLLVRALVIAVAAPIGPESPLAALLIVPIAALARLVSYVGMFLAVRRGMRTYSEISGGDVSFESFMDAAGEFIRVLLASIIPFFTLYAIIGLVAEDLSDYARAAFWYSIGSENGVLRVGDGPLVVLVIVVALAGRLLLKVFGSKLPRWLAVVEIYLEATWIFVALTGVSAVFGQVIEWIEQRRVVDWVLNAREFLTSLADPIRVLVESIDWLAPVVAQLILLPLAWLLIAGVIYTRALANVVDDRVLPDRVEQTVARGFSRLPRILQRQAYLLTDEWDDVGSPFTQSGKLIARAGVVSLTSFVSTYGVLFALGEWFSFGVYRLIGPHEQSWWYTIDPLLSVAVTVVIEPVRIVLLAAAFDWCLRRWQERRSLAQPENSVLPENAVLPENSVLEVEPVDSV